MGKKQFFFIAGLPRSGSTLLSNILGQNPEIRAEGNSALATLMWESQVACDVKGVEQLMATGKFPSLKNRLLSELPSIYYAEAQEPIIFDKCRKWCSHENMQVIKNHITQKPKVIVVVRPVEEIVKSFVNLHKLNGKPFNVKNNLMDRDKNPILVESILSVRDAINNCDDDFLFIKYSDLVDDAESVLKKIYKFCELDYFNHTFTNIVDRCLEDDAVYGLIGMHSVRQSISKKSYDIELDQCTLDFCNEANTLIKKSLE